MTQRIYTRTGDSGETGLFGGGRVPKHHARVEAYGAVDELNAALGWSATVVNDARISGCIDSVQPDLFAIGAHLATSARDDRPPPKLPPLPAPNIAQLERWIDDADAALPELSTFIMPGGCAGGAALHVARTVCRRAERRVVELAAQEAVADSIVSYLNRLSDLLFVWARLENQLAGRAERPWRPGPGA
ncbi:MAG TPA: cob(I)yrinic acid a,c-diamide adenosyltransferase [Longimicrobiales bacterium]|nr:cob(I)yrinic acid a,c-diamide adenosyltransferase [Longimicrobiales bacterium]